MEIKFDFLKTTLFGGIVFLLQLALLGMVIGKVVQVMNLLAGNLESEVEKLSMKPVVVKLQEHSKI